MTPYEIGVLIPYLLFEKSKYGTSLFRTGQAYQKSKCKMQLPSGRKVTGKIVVRKQEPAPRTKPRINFSNKVNAGQAILVRDKQWIVGANQ